MFIYKQGFSLPSPPPQSGKMEETYREKQQSLKRKHHLLEAECLRLRSEIEEVWKVQRDLQAGNKSLKEKLVSALRVKEKLQKKAKLEDCEGKIEDSANT